MSKILLGTFAICLALVIWGFVIEPGLLVQRNAKIRQWTGPTLKIVFLADLHAGSPHIDVRYIESLVSRINALSPDIVLIGGDLVINGVLAGNPIPIEQVASLLKELKAPLGVYSVLGNHDWWNDGDLIRSTLEKNGIPVLDNQATRIQVGPDFHFWLIGIGDDYTDHAHAEFALSQITSEAPRILFMHDPAAVLQVQSRFFLALAGHMHGGQVDIPGLGALVTPGKAPSDWARGWVHLEVGSLFVSKGIGTSILPVRFNAPPEFVLIELQQ